MSVRQITVFGGSGFIGRYVVERLAQQGDRVKVAVRHPHEALYLKPLGDVGQIELISANVTDKASVERAIIGADMVINLVGILQKSGRQTFERLHSDGPANIAEASSAAGVKSLVHISAIGAAADSPSLYARTKAEGEERVFSSFPRATILRPSLVIGYEDGFFNRFAELSKFLPVLPIPGLNTKFQPVYVGDVADAALKALDAGEDVEGRIFELGGPEVMTMGALLQRLMKIIHRKRTFVNVPVPIAKIQAICFSVLPNPPLTLDQLKLLEVDNVVSDKMPGLQDLGITPTAIDAVVPRYAAQYRPKGQFE